MNSALRISIAANVFLALLALWLAGRVPAGDRYSDAPPAPSSVLLPDPKAGVPLANGIPLSAQPFRWSQLESMDYRTYVANLRGVGCPEQTTRDILTADLDSAYAPRRAQFERNLTAGLAARREAEAGLQELRGEEAYALATLLGDALPASQPAAKTPAWVLAKRNARSVMPIALQNIDLAALNLDPDQTAAINQVRQSFQQELGTQNPNDPAYRERWNAAQRNADDVLKGLLGTRAFLEMRAASRFSQ